MKNKILIPLINFFKKNKSSKKFWALVVFNAICYLAAFPLGMLVSFIWWLFSSGKISKKAQKIIVYSTVGIVFLFMTFIVYAYSSDPEPTLDMGDIADNQVVQVPSIELSGQYTPEDFSVKVNGEKIDANNGSFSYNYPLELGENEIEVRVSNYKSVSKKLTVTRELSPEEIAQQEAEKKRIEEEKMAEEARKNEDAQKKEVEKQNEVAQPDPEESPAEAQEEETKGFFEKLGFGETVFDESRALSKLKDYRFTASIKGKSAERYLHQYFSELARDVSGIEEGNWQVLGGDAESGYYITYVYQEYGDHKNPKWLVTEEKIVAVDGESRLITPDLAPEGYDLKDELIYDSFNTNLSKLMDTKPNSTAEQIDAIYEEAYQLTAKEYEITVEEVEAAIARSQKANTIN